MGSGGGIEGGAPQGDSGVADPGAARQGNFINYYSFNPPSERLVHLPPDLLRNCLDLKGEGGGSCLTTALDVGCNSGDLTCGLYDLLVETTSGAGTAATAIPPNATSSSKENDSQLCQRVQVLGVDVDPQLIEVAQRDHKEKMAAGGVDFRTLDVTDNQDGSVDTILREYLQQFPEKNCDRGGAMKMEKKFDVIFCFSVSMWIHLNHGDRGLSNFFSTLSKWCRRYLVLEPQPWKCYRTASRRMRKLKQPDFGHLKEMEAQSEEQLRQFIDKLCRQNGFRQLKVFGETANWKRRIILSKVRRSTRE